MFQDHSLSKASRKHSLQGPKLAVLKQRLAVAGQRRRSLHCQTVQSREHSQKLRVVAWLDKQYFRKLHSAAVQIQRVARGFLVRRFQQRTALQTQKGQLRTAIASLATKVEHCWIHMNDLPAKAALLIQKHTRGFLVRSRLRTQRLLAAQQERAATQLQAYFRGWRVRRAVNLPAVLERNARLRQIQERLRWLWFEQFWQTRRLNWTVFQRQAAGFLLNIDSQAFEKPPKHRRKSIGDLPSAMPGDGLGSRQDSEGPALFDSQVLVSKGKMYRGSAHFMRPTKTFLSKLVPAIEEPVLQKPSGPVVSNRRFQRSTVSRDLYVQARLEKPRLSAVPKRQRRASVAPCTDFNFPPLIHLEHLGFGRRQSPEWSRDELDWAEDPVYFDAEASSAVFKDALPHLYSFVEKYGMNVK